MKAFDLTFDNGLGALSSDRAWKFRCISVFLQIPDNYRPAESFDADIDFEDYGGREYGKDEYTVSYNIIISTRINVDRLIDWKGREAMKRQWTENLDDETL